MHKYNVYIVYISQLSDLIPFIGNTTIVEILRVKSIANQVASVFYS